jgi:hypothetical protein
LGFGSGALERAALAAERQEELPELFGGQLLAATSEAEAIGSEHAPGKALVFSLEGHHADEHLVDGLCATTRGNLLEQHGFQRFHSALPLHFDVGVEWCAGRDELLRNGQPSRARRGA